MKCPRCGYSSSDRLETCIRCGTPMVATSGAAGAPPAGAARDVHAALLDVDSLEIAEHELDASLASRPGFDGKDGADGDDASHLFHLDDDLFKQFESTDAEAPWQVAGLAGWGGQEDSPPEESEDLPGPALAFSGYERDLDGMGEPIIDRDDEVPERYWEPEVAGLGRRALALAVDQALLTAVLGLFYLGALFALRLNEIAAAGLQASVLPFGLLAVVLSFSYFSYFHGSTGCTPGKALVGIEVRTGAGGALGLGRAMLRWLGAALGLTCAGVGVLWAFFEPRRRGWADHLSGTVVARPRR